MTRFRRIALFCGLTGLACLIAFEFTDSHVGPDGQLHEVFALQASGMLLLLGAVLIEIAHWVPRLWRWIRSLMA